MTAAARIGFGLAGLVLVLVVAAGAGTVLGVGPLAPSPPPSEVTDPDEMLARSLQSVIDASAVHLEGTVSGSLAAGLAGDGAEAVDLDLTTLSLDIRPKDAKTRIHVEMPHAGLVLDAVSVWDTVYWRTDPEDAWTESSLGAASAEAGIDANPLTIVDRLRAYLEANPDIVDGYQTVVCPHDGTSCRRIVADAGPDPAAILALLLPPERIAALPAVDTTVEVLASVDTLRPVRLVVDARSADGRLVLHLVVDASRWDEDIRIEEPPDDEVAPG
jgi:hypothetical protein